MSTIDDTCLFCESALPQGKNLDPVLEVPWCIACNSPGRAGAVYLKYMGLSVIITIEHLRNSTPHRWTFSPDMTKMGCEFCGLKMPANYLAKAESPYRINCNRPSIRNRKVKPGDPITGTREIKTTTLLVVAEDGMLTYTNIGDLIETI